MAGFKTGNCAPDGREVVFIPTAPNITTGFIVELDGSVEDALTRVISCGFGEAPQQDAQPAEQASDSPSLPATDRPSALHDRSDQ